MAGGLPGPSLMGNPWLVVLDRFGFPMLMAGILGYALWTMVTSLTPRLDKIEATLESRNATYFEPMLANQRDTLNAMHDTVVRLDKIEASLAPLAHSDDTIVANQKDIVERVRGVETQIKVIEANVNIYEAHATDTQSQLARRLDDIYRMAQATDEQKARLNQKPPGG